MNTPLVSIITPSYNSADFIAETIQSVKAQTYQNWEMLITDDGSTDNTIAIIETYTKHDPRIKLYRSNLRSGSPAAPRNRSIKEAKGKYIAFLDSDDLWEPFKLSEQVEFAETNQYAVVFSHYEKIMYDGQRNGRLVMTANQYDYRDLLKTDGIPWLTLMIRKDAIGSLSFIKEKKEDYIFLLALLRKGFIAYNTGKMHALYRITPNSRSGNKLKMVRSQWNIIRKYESVGLLKSIYCMAIYLFCGLRKYLI